MNPELLCMGCMARKAKGEVCAQCGYADRGAQNTQQLPPHTILEGKYVIGRPLGQGGFGITYLAFDLELNKRLAIKEYFPVQISTRSQDRLTVSPISIKSQPDLEYGLGKFAEEAKALSHFKDHPGVVSLLGFFHANGTAYIVMAYVEGHDLKVYLNQHGGKIPFEAALRIVLLVMAALEDVHRAGIVHRDISPDNIYVEENGGVRILDFGATRFAMGEQSRSLSVVLKPGYAPEEQYRGKGRQGPWTDIYALGATFYRAITGVVPPEALDRMDQLVGDEIVSPSGRGIAIPPNSEAALMKALAVKAENRFQTVAEFREAIMPQSVAQPPPVLRVPPPPPPPREPIKAPEFGTPGPVVSSAHLPKVFLLTAISILLLILFIATISRGTAGESMGSDAIVGIHLIALLILFGLMMFVFVEAWKSIQDGHARTTPENAVAYSFIPVFNFYWAFPVLWGFAKDYNNFLDRHSRGGKRLNEDIFLISSISYVVGCVVIPFGGFFAALLIFLNSCFLLPVVAMICDAVNGLATRPWSQGITPEKLFSLYCVSGEFQGENLGVDSRGLIIGRSPHANLVLSADEISARHACVWPDSANAGVWIEDLKSTNGTFYRQSKSGGHAAGWVRVEGRKLLFVGDRFRLSGGGPEFEVKAN